MKAFRPAYASFTACSAAGLRPAAAPAARAVTTTEIGSMVSLPLSQRAFGHPLGNRAANFAPCRDPVRWIQPLRSADEIGGDQYRINSPTPCQVVLAATDPSRGDIPLREVKSLAGCGMVQAT